MKVFQRSTQPLWLSPGQMGRELACELLPQSKLLSIRSDEHFARLLLELSSSLFAFDFFDHELGTEAVDSIPKALAWVKAEQRFRNGQLCGEPGLYWVARGFGDDLMGHPSLNSSGIRLFVWSVISSRAEQNILVSELFPKAIVSDEASAPATNPFSGVPLSTPELVAFARLGMQLRNIHPAEL